MPLQKARANATPNQNAPADKLTGQSRTRSLVATAEQTFDYSDGDWVKIERAIESVRQTPLTGQERRDLQNAADNIDVELRIAQLETTEVHCKEWRPGIRQESYPKRAVAPA
jgi:hypothetical protein